MKKILIGLLLVATPALAEVTELKMTVYCNPYRTVVGNLMVDHDERMLWEGQEEDTYTALYANRNTGGWTLIKYDEDKIAACVLSAGLGYDTPD